MKLVRFAEQKSIRWGILEDESIRIIQGELFFVSALSRCAAGVKMIKLSRRKVPLKEVRLLAPTIPTKIVLVGLNYRDHAKELKMKVPNEPILFLKPPTSVIGPHQTIIYPDGVCRLDYEAELAVVIGEKCKNVSSEEAPKYILGYTCLNDVTARDLQKKDGQWTRAKSFDTFCPLGPCIETNLDPSNLKISLYLNGQLKQNSSTKNFIFSVNFLVSFISKIMALSPGDVISTGTPAGVGPMKPADTVEVEIEKIGRLTNKIKK